MNESKLIAHCRDFRDSLYIEHYHDAARRLLEASALPDTASIEQERIEITTVRRNLHAIADSWKIDPAPGLQIVEDRKHMYGVFLQAAVDDAGPEKATIAKTPIFSQVITDYTQRHRGALAWCCAILLKKEGDQL